MYATLGRFSADEEAELLERHGIADVTCGDLPRGVVVGTVELWGCTGTGGDYHWHLREPQRAQKLLKPTGRPQPTWFEPFQQASIGDRDRDQSKAQLGGNFPHEWKIAPDGTTALSMASTAVCRGKPIPPNTTAGWRAP